MRDGLSWSAALEITQQSERDTYRVIVLAQNGTELLLTRADTRFFLPSVEIPRWQRIAENLTAATKSKWGCETICLFAPDADSTSHFTGVHYQVLECWNRAETHDAPVEWVPVSSLLEKSFQDSADYLAVQQSITECNAHARGTGGPFAQLGWFRELQTWAGEAIRPLGLQLKGPFCQFNASPSFNLIRFETDGPAIWFKAVGEPNLREFPITVALAQLLPKYVPAILGTRPEWNGWLAPEIEGVNLGESRKIALWQSAAAALAELQIESVGKTRQLFDSGARDLRAVTLSRLVHPFLDYIGEAMKQQVKVPPPVLAQQELESLAENIMEALSLLEQLGIPDALGHLDLNPGNIVVSPPECVFLDWAEAYVGHPFFSFHYLLEHFRRSLAVDVGLEAELTASYAEHWRALVSPNYVLEALSLASILSVFTYAAGNDAWTDQQRQGDPKVAGYLRSLTRRMNHEFHRFSDRKSTCRN